MIESMGHLVKSIAMMEHEMTKEMFVQLGKMRENVINFVISNGKVNDLVAS